MDFFYCDDEEVVIENCKNGFVMSVKKKGWRDRAAEIAEEFSKNFLDMKFSIVKEYIDGNLDPNLFDAAKVFDRAAKIWFLMEATMANSAHFAENPEMLKLCLICLKFMDMDYFSVEEFEFLERFLLKNIGVEDFPKEWPWITEIKKQHFEGYNQVMLELSCLPPSNLVKEGGYDYQTSAINFGKNI